MKTPNVVKFWAVVISVAITTFFFWALQSPIRAVPVESAEAREHQYDYHPDHRDEHPMQEKQGYSYQKEEDNLPDQIANIFLEQGWIGAMLLLVMAYMHYSQKTARSDRIKLEDKLVEMLKNSNNVQLENVKELSKIGSELENISREMERIRG